MRYAVRMNQISFSRLFSGSRGAQNLGTNEMSLIEADKGPLGLLGQSVNVEFRTK